MMDMTSIEPGGYEHRFGGLFRLYGAGGVERLRNAHVLVVGVGGVGSWAAEALSRCGVGEISLIDFDEACYSNVNRQIHAMTGTIGAAKVDLVAERMRLINPECRVHPIRDFYSDKNAEVLVPKQLSYVVDAIDSKHAKIHLITHCHKAGIPIIVSGGAGGRVDPSQIQTKDLSASYNDPLLAQLRKQLRRNLGMRGQQTKKFQIPCVFSAESTRYYHLDGTVRDKKPAPIDAASQGEGFRIFGTASFLTGSFGFAMAARVIKELVGE